MKLTQMVLAVAALVLLTSVSQASVVLRLTDLGTNSSVTVSDGSGSDANGAANAVTFIGALGVWNLNVTTGLSSSGQPGIPTLDLNSVDSSTGAGSLKIEVTDTNFASASSPIALVGNIGGTTPGSVSASGWLDPSNTAFGHGGGSLGLGPFNTPAFSGSGNSGVIGLNGPFSITGEVVITHNAAGATSFNFQSQAVPEPATIAIWSALGAAGAGAVASKRRKNAGWSTESRNAIFDIIEGKRS